jgi:restriction endonuclease S subunit
MKCTKKKLGDISTIQTGVYEKSSYGGEVACLQVGDLLPGATVASAMKVARSKRIDNYILQKGDLLFAGKGTTYLCKIFDFDILAVPSTTLYSVRLQTDAASPEYLCWYLNHPNIVAEVKKSQSGAGTPLIHKSTLENLEIMLPDKETQKRIVELSVLQSREEYLLKTIAERRSQIVNQILINELNK